MKFHITLLIIVLTLALSACGLGGRQSEDNNADKRYDYASGGLAFSVLLNGVGAQVNSVEVRLADADGIPGYVFVILTVSLVNESDAPVVPGGFKLIDELSNEYISWQTNVPFGDQLQGLPLAVEQGQSVTGHQVYIVPTSALHANLRMRWESDLHESRIDIFLGPLRVE